MEAGAQVLQVVTANRQLRGLAAPIINRGLLHAVGQRGLRGIEVLVGSAA